MPSKNVVKVDISHSYYHVYGRGSSRRDIFLDDQDNQVFLNLFKRYLSHNKTADSNGLNYPNFYGQLELLCYCLMSNHFHLLVYQIDERSMTEVMRSVMTSYTRYFNKKYNFTGALLESRYKASLISNDSYLQHITRYIHLNPKNWQNYPYSSLPYYLGNNHADWVKPGRVIEMFSNPAEYLEFVKDYEDNKKMLDELKYELANTIKT